MRSLAAALQFLTRLPLPVATQKKDLAASIIWFPLVGGLLGLAAWGLWWLAALTLPDPLARMLSLGLMLWLYGAFHLDGLADSVDGFYGGRKPGQVLRIMKDPCVGAMGAVALGAVLLTRATALWVAPLDVLPLAFIAAPLLSHSAMAAALALPLFRKSGLAYAFDSPHRRVLSIAAASAGIVLVAVLLRGAAWKPIVAAVAVSACWLRYAYKRLGGVNGDVAGATAEWVELAAWIALAPAGGG
jgi:adenosylcobinamide-GDP ribazoletransferase